VYFLGATSRQLRVEVNGEVQSYDVAQVQLVFFSNPTDTPPVPAATRADASIGIAIPSDTAITVRTIDSVNSDIARTGHTFMASPDEPVCVDGGSVIPRGADLMPKLVYDQQAGKLRGRTVLTLALVPVKATDIGWMLPARMSAGRAIRRPRNRPKRWVESPRLGLLSAALRAAERVRRSAQAPVRLPARAPRS
jgi:hypothetical protein